MLDSSNFSYLLLVDVLRQLSQVEVDNVQLVYISVNLFHGRLASNQITCEVSLFVSHSVLSFDFVSFLRCGVGSVGSDLGIVVVVVIVQGRFQMVLLLLFHLVGVRVSFVSLSWISPVHLAVSKVVSLPFCCGCFDWTVSFSICTLDVRIKMIFLSVLVFKIVNIQRLLLNWSIIRVISLLEHLGFKLVLSQVKSIVLSAFIIGFGISTLGRPVSSSAKGMWNNLLIILWLLVLILDSEDIRV